MKLLENNKQWNMTFESDAMLKNWKTPVMFLFHKGRGERTELKNFM